MDNNVTVAFMVVLIGLWNIIVALRKGRIAFLPTFSRWANEDVRKFIWWLEVVFLAN